MSDDDPNPKPLRPFANREAINLETIPVSGIMNFISEEAVQLLDDKIKRLDELASDEQAHEMTNEVRQHAKNMEKVLRDSVELALYATTSREIGGKGGSGTLFDVRTPENVADMHLRFQKAGEFLLENSAPFRFGEETTLLLQAMLNDISAQLQAKAKDKLSELAKGIGR